MGLEVGKDREIMGCVCGWVTACACICSSEFCK